MKRLIAMQAAILALSLSLSAHQGHGKEGGCCRKGHGRQQAAQANQQGDRHTPHAWGDKDKDGKCDSTGKPIGQHRRGNAAQTVESAK